ncbi:FlgD immunoglobulin-like domain containing protein, partial [Streptomyces sp. NPDC000878]
MRRTTLRTVLRSRSRRARGAVVSVGAALVIVAGLLQFTSVPAVAADGGDMPTVTLTGVHRTQPRSASLAAVDDSGYLSVPQPYSTDSPAVWTGRDGSTRDIPSHGSTTAYNGGLGLEKVPGTTNVYEIRRYSTNKVTRFYVPAGDRVTKVFAENRLLVSRQVGGKWTLILLEMPAGGGQLVERPVTGVDDDFNGWTREEASDTQGATFGYQPDDVNHPWRTALLDFDTAALTYVPTDDFGMLEYPHLAGDTVLFYAIDKAFDTSRLYVVDREHPETPGHLVDVPESALLKARAIGDWVLYPEPVDNATNAILAVPVTGGPARTLLTASAGDFVDGDDGSFSIEGGTDAEHWAVQRVTLGADGVPVVEPVAPLPAVSVYEVGGVAVDQGRVLLGTERMDRSATDLTASALSLAADGTLTAAPPENLGDLGYDVEDPFGSPVHVQCSSECLRFTGTGEGNILHSDDKVSAVVAASGSYSVVRAGGTQQVRDGSKVLATGSWPAVALWGNTLWTARTDSLGEYERYSLPSMRKLDSLFFGSCVPTDLQVVGRYVYWSCGPNKQAGVYDQTTHAEQDVPRGYARLGDGYLVSQDDNAGKLLITYLRGAVPADRVGTENLGPLPSPAYAPADLRGRFWNVDRFGGPVAYSTVSGDLAVKWPQVTTSPLAATDATAPTSVDLRQGTHFKGVWHLTRPAASWKLTVATSAGAVVRTVTGGLARGKVTAAWDGRAENGALVRTGIYRVKLTARVASEITADSDTVIYDKPLSVRSPERHDFGRDGIGDLVTFDSAG